MVCRANHPSQTNELPGRLPLHLTRASKYANRRLLHLQITFHLHIAGIQAVKEKTCVSLVRDARLLRPYVVLESTGRSETIQGPPIPGCHHKSQPDGSKSLVSIAAGTQRKSQSVCHRRQSASTKACEPQFRSSNREIGPSGPSDSLMQNYPSRLVDRPRLQRRKACRH